MKIVLLNQYYAPDEAATAQMLADVGAALAASGHEVTAICCNRSYADPSRRYAKRESIGGVAVERVNVTGFGRRNVLGRLIDYLSFYCGAALRLTSVGRPDVVLSLTTPPMISLLGAAIGRLRGAQTVLWSMDVYPDIVYELQQLERKSLAGIALGWLARRTLALQDAVIALGESMAARLRKTNARRVEVIHNWADEAAIQPMPAQESALRAEWGWGNRFVLLYSGNLGLAHEFDTAIRAAHALRDDTSILFAFVGAGPRLAYVREQKNALRLDNVEIRDPVPRERLQESLAAGDVHLVTLRPRMAGLLVPSKIYGILAAGRPSMYVGPAEGEVFDIIRSGSCGTRVENGDVDGLVSAIRRYRDDAGARSAEGVRARQMFEARFTKREGVERMRSVLESVRHKSA